MPITDRCQLCTLAATCTRVAVTMLGWQQNPGLVGGCWALHALGLPSRETNSQYRAL